MYGGNLTSNYHNSFVRLTNLIRDLSEKMRSLGEPPIEMGYQSIYNESLISRARNRLADAYLKQGFDSQKKPYTHAIFIDADIGFEPEDIIAMLESDLDIIGAPCVRKEIRWDRIQRAIRRPGSREYSAEELKRIGGSFVVNYLPGKTAIADLAKPEQVRHLGTGILMVKREVFLKFKEVYSDRWYEPRCDPNSLPGPIWDFFKCGINPETREYDSEDYWFIHDCCAMGYKAYLMPFMRTTHMGTYEYIGDMPASAVLAGDVY